MTKKIYRKNANKENLSDNSDVKVYIGELDDFNEEDLNIIKDILKKNMGLASKSNLL